MENKKDIGKAFREKLDNLERSSGNNVWQSIQNELQQKKKRRGIPFWLRTVGFSVAALVLIGIFTHSIWKDTVPSIYFKMPEGTHHNTPPQNIDGAADETCIPGNNSGNPSYNESGKATSSDGRPIRSSKTGPYPDRVKAKDEFGGTANTSNPAQLNRRNNRTGSADTGTSSGNTTSVNALAIGRSRKHDKSSLAAQTGETKRNSAGKVKGEKLQNNSVIKLAKVKTADNIAGQAVKADDNINATTGKTLAETADAMHLDSITKVTDSVKAVAKVTELKSQEEQKKQQTPAGPDYKNMYIYGFIAPTYYNPNNSGYIDRSLEGKETSVEKSFSYGAYLGYNLTPKFSIRVGVIGTQLQLVTKGAVIVNSYVWPEQTPENPNGILEIVVPRNYTGITYAGGVSNNSIMQALGQELDEHLQPYATVDIHQDVQYLEIPLEATYIIHGDKLRFGITGGFSTRYLSKNSIYASNGSGRIFMGSYNNMNKISFGASLGTGVYYQLIPSLQINAEPLVKYYFNAPDNIKPLTFGVQAGLQYNFNLSKKKN